MYDVSPIWIRSPVRPRKAGTANVAWALPAVMSTSADAVVPVRATVAPGAPVPLRSALMLPSRVASTWTLLAVSLVRRAAVTISFGSVRAGAPEPLQALTAIVAAASRPSTRATRVVVGDM